MKKKSKIGIARARIEGLMKDPWYFEEKCYWAWTICFNDPSTLSLDNLAFIKVGTTEEEAKLCVDQLRDKFNDLGIVENSAVVVIMQDGAVRAIGSNGKNCWIDVSDNFTPKKFKELHMKVKSLNVY